MKMFSTLRYCHLVDSMTKIWHTARLHDFRGIHNETNILNYLFSYFLLVVNQICDFFSYFQLVVDQICDFLFCLSLFFLFCNLIVKKTLSTHHWRYVVDKTTKISHSAELHDFQTLTCKYDQQHSFYLVACREKHLRLISIFFWSCGWR